MTGTDTPMTIAKGSVIIVAVMAVFMLVMEVVVVLEPIITRKVYHVCTYVLRFACSVCAKFLGSRGGGGGM